MVFSDCKGIVHQEFVPRRQMVNEEVYQGILARLQDAVHSNKPELWETQTWLLQHDNAPCLQLSSKTSHSLCLIHRTFQT